MSARPLWHVAEALRNVRSYALLGVVVFALAALSGYLTVAAAASQVGDIVTRHESMVARGLDVWRVQVKEPFSAQECDSLRRVDGIRDAGSVLSQESAAIDLFPGSSVSLVTATPGYIRIVWDVEVASAVGIGSEISATFGVRSESAFVLHSTKTPPSSWRMEGATLLPSTSRVAGANQSIVAVSLPSGDTRECLIEAEVGARSAVESYLLSKFAGNSVVSPLFTDTGVGKSVDEELTGRLSQWIPPAAALLIGSISLLSLFGRRADFALYQLVGVPRSGFVYMAVTEVAITAWLPFAIGSAIAVICNAASLEDGLVLEAASGDYMRTAALLLIIPVIALLIFWRRDPLSWLKGE
ncbi:hypothetical protein [Microbacterium sp.]|uniref:hypothetical protein n=1 Tax=Microbacterium sp. TaxID=51671 RepID=UPI003A9560D8